MALKDLSAQTMAHLSGAWLDPDGDRPTLEGLTRVRPLLPDLTAAHAALVAAHTRDDTPSQVEAIRAEQADIDTVHDRKARGVYGALTSIAELTDDPDEAARILGIRDTLFPGGLRFITRSYTDEAGEARFARARLDGDTRAALAAIPIPGGSLLDAVDAWLDAGEQLGALEDQRAALEATPAVPAPSRTQRGQRLKARNGWIRVVRAVLSMLELEAISAEDRGGILGTLEHELARAERRIARSNGGAAGDDTGADTGGDSAGGDGVTGADTGGEAGDDTCAGGAGGDGVTGADTSGEAGAESGAGEAPAEAASA